MNVHGLSDDEWDFLLFIPFVVFFSVAYADGKIAPAETNTFSGVVGRMAKANSSGADALTVDVMRAISSDFAGLANRVDSLAGSGVSFGDITAAGRLVLETKIEPLSAQSYRQSVLRLGQLIAEAWPLFSKGSPQERDVLARIASAIGLDSPHRGLIPFAEG